MCVLAYVCVCEAGIFVFFFFNVCDSSVRAVFV